MQLNESAALVIGGGVAGIASALSLAESGARVHLVEKEADIGGHGARLCCKATDVCRHCGACIVADRIERVRSNSDVSILTRTELKSLSGRAGDFHAALVSHESEKEALLDVNTVIVATGFAPFDARQKPHLGYKTCANVITGLDLEEQIRRTGSVALAGDGRAPKKIAFVQCVGSRDAHIGNDYCSRACCKYALRMAGLLQWRIPELELTIFYLDIQTGGKGFYDFYQDCRKTMRFVRCIPVEVAQNGSASLEVKYEDMVQGRLTREPFDMVVLSVGMAPDPDAADLARVLGVALDSRSFFETPDPTDTNRSDVDGIFVAGACRGPKDIEASIAHAQAASVRAVSFLGAL